MRRKIMTTILLGSLSFASLAQAGVTEFFDLFASGNQVDTGKIGEFVFAYPSKNSADLRFEPDMFMYPGSMNLSRIDLRFFREYLTPGDQVVVNRLVWQVASRCMNISPERKNALLTWVAQQNKIAKGKQMATFGPLTVRYERFIDVKGQYLTVIGLGRSTAPGVSPWVNYCEYTGGAG